METQLISSIFSAVSIKGNGIVFNVMGTDTIPIFTINTFTKKALLIGGLCLQDLIIKGVGTVLTILDINDAVVFSVNATTGDIFFAGDLTVQSISIVGDGSVFNVMDGIGTPVFTINTTTGVANLLGDLFVEEISWTSIAPGIIVPGKVGNSRVLEVGSDIMQYATIEAALMAANALVPPPSFNSGVVIRVYPGTYVENNPLVLPAGLVVVGKGGSASNTKIMPINADILFDMQGFGSGLENLFVVGNEVATVGINCNTPNVKFLLDRVFLSGCDTGILIDGINATTTMTECLLNSTIGQTITIGIHLLNGAHANMITASIKRTTSPNPLTNGLLSDNAGGEGIIFTGSLIDNATTGISVNGSLMDIITSKITTCTTAINIDLNSIVTLNGGIFADNTRDVNVIDTASTLTVSGTSMIGEGVVYNPASNTNLAYFNNSNINTGFTVEGGLIIGSIDNPTKSSFGEGMSYITNMSVLTYEITGAVFTDVTDDIANPIANPVTIFPNLLAGSIIYIGGDDKYVGLFDNILTPVTLGGGTLIFEYFNGAWTSFNFMVTQAESPFHSYAENIFSAVEEQQIRFGRISNDWVTTSVNSITKYWTRVRIVTAITASPILQLNKLQSSAARINKSGYIEYFGTARPIRQIPYDINTARAANNSPSNQDIYLSNNLNFGNVQNSFFNSDVDRTGMKFYLPPEIDTSFGVDLVWTWFGTVTGGDVQWTIRWGYTTLADIVYTSFGASPATWPNESTVVINDPVPGTERELKTTTTNLSIPNMISRQNGGLPQDILVVTLERDGPADSNTGLVAIMQVAPFYHAWCNGLYTDS